MERYRRESRRRERTLRSLQLSRGRCSEAECNQVLAQHYKNITGYTPDIVTTVRWTPYFPRWSPSQVVEGRLWDIFSMQGKYRTWYAGSSVCYESVKSVMEYNKLLLRQMFS